jgi:hypothetical protein
MNARDVRLPLAEEYAMGHGCCDSATAAGRAVNRDSDEQYSLLNYNAL